MTDQIRTEPLTEQELAAMEEYRKEARAKGFSTGPSDRPKVEEAAREVYRAAGFDSPRQMVWAASPLGGVIMAASMKLLADEGFLDL